MSKDDWQFLPPVSARHKITYDTVQLTEAEVLATQDAGVLPDEVREKLDDRAGYNGGDVEISGRADTGQGKSAADTVKAKGENSSK